MANAFGLTDYLNLHPVAVTSEAAMMRCIGSTGQAEPDHGPWLQGQVSLCSCGGQVFMCSCG